MTNGESFTVKEIVLDIRDTVKTLSEKIDRIDRTGSIGTRAELEDHENRIRATEVMVVAIQAERNVQKDSGARKIAWGAVVASCVGGFWWVSDAVAKFTAHG